MQASSYANFAANPGFPGARHAHSSLRIAAPIPQVKWLSKRPVHGGRSPISRLRTATAYSSHMNFMCFDQMSARASRLTHGFSIRSSAAAYIA